MDPISKHIESVYDKAKKYTETTIELHRLNAINTTADIVSSLASRLIFALIISMFTLFVNIAISLLIGKHIGDYYLGFLIVSVFYLIMAIIIYSFNAILIKEPISNLVIVKLLKTNKLKPSSFNLDENESL